ncbi:tRNA (guanosine(37)-N1)-methyltransferase TrmD [Bacillus carboniphilus]|uniref:tRNA (guanine-N(1)-)-methyltransferase n=1 Tax=Bacillus carboniphilus TaxID=86663 RepID=A0ABY9JVY2_9BACI|nr:tRNA (guanosine(37)-N1)-methyltransferase TrmD [Bacillus carboniphilus]WLR43556.1 tRNA (guanosine(37)-N1)-methyltransferase TrmD [Bacillus carboniphilus]
MKIDILTLFPEMFPGVLNQSILKRAQENEIVDFSIHNIRSFSENKHRTVDDYPYGGGAGMVLKPEPVFNAIGKLTEGQKQRSKIILVCPQGERYSQQKAEQLAKEDHLMFICGHYEGYDERIRENLITDEISIGDFVLTGGELASMVIIDSVVRLLPGVLGKEQSHQNDSFSTGMLEHPHYTRPATYKGFKVPQELLSGNHALIEKWRQKESLRRTWMRRPDLLDKIDLSDEQKEWLKEIKEES